MTATYRTLRAIYLDKTRIPAGRENVAIDDRRAEWLMQNGAIVPMQGSATAPRAATASNGSARSRVGGCAGCGWR